jgi:hypothetical protein
MGLPKQPQIVENWPRQRHEPLPVAFADDAKPKIGAVDRFDFEGRRLADAQPAGVHQGQAASVGRAGYAAKDGANLRVGKYVRQPPLLWRANLFFKKSGQSRSSVRL